MASKQQELIQQLLETMDDPSELLGYGRVGGTNAHLPSSIPFP